MRSLSIIVVAWLISTSVYAQKIAVEKGKIDFLKNEKELAVEFTYIDMSVGKMREEDYVARKMSEADSKNPGSGETWFQAWNRDRSARFEPKFIELFNKQMESKGGVVIDTDAGGNYLMTVNTFFTEPGYNIGISRRNAAVSLRATITERETGAMIAVISVVNSSANDFLGTDFDVAYRIQESYAKAGRELAKFLIKKLKLG